MHQNIHKDLILLTLLKTLLDCYANNTIRITVKNVPFFVANFEYSFLVLSKQIYNILSFHFYKMFTEFSKNSKVVSSDFSMMKNIVAPWAWCPSLSIKLICCGSFHLVYLLKLIAIVLEYSLKQVKSNKLPVV